MDLVTSSPTSAFLVVLWFAQLLRTLLTFFVHLFSEGSATSPIFLTYLLLESLKPEWIHFSTY